MIGNEKYCPPKFNDKMNLKVEQWDKNIEWEKK